MEGERKEGEKKREGRKKKGTGRKVEEGRLEREEQRLERGTRSDKWRTEKEIGEKKERKESVDISRSHSLDHTILEY